MTASTVDDAAIGWQFENTYSRLPDVFWAPAQPATVREPRLVLLNHRLAHELGLNFHGLPPESAAGLFAGQLLPGGSHPLAQAYAGHQYGHFTMLGDGRAILLGEHRTPSGRLVDLQWKGPGPTPFSRRGDGRAALGPMLREYLISEAMAALGIPTTRSLAVVTTGEPVYRATVLRGAVLTRVAASHIRVGTFEFIAARQHLDQLRQLADYTIARHDPSLIDAPDKYLAFLRSVIDRQAALVAQWQLVGFIHGVMNTDNMAVSGETIDYGPCAFMNVYHPETVFSSIDHHGRYAYRNQPAIALWNLTRLAESLLPLLDADQDRVVTAATALLEEFSKRFQCYWQTGMRRKLGLQTEAAEDAELIQALLDWMQTRKADFTNTFRDLSEGVTNGEQYRDPEFIAWFARWQQRLPQEGVPRSVIAERMQAVNPAVIPRNHLVEAALTDAEARDDLAAFQQLLTAVSTPFVSDRPACERTPPPEDAGYQTFCGT